MDSTIERVFIPHLIEILSFGSMREKETAAYALCSILNNDKNRVATTRKGGIIPLIELLENGSMRATEGAAAALMKVTVNNNNNRVIIRLQGGIKPLIELLVNGSIEAKENAAGALCNLSLNDNNGMIIRQTLGIKPLIDVLVNGAKEKVSGAMWRNGDYIKERRIKSLIKLLLDVSVAAKENAAGALWNMSVNNDNKVKIGEGGIKILVELVVNGSVVAKENAAGALWVAEKYEEIANEGGIEPLIAMFTTNQNSRRTLISLVLPTNKELLVAQAAIASLPNIAQQASHVLTLIFQLNQTTVLPQQTTPPVPSPELMYVFFLYYFYLLLIVLHSK